MPLPPSRPPVVQPAPKGVPAGWWKALGAPPMGTSQPLEVDAEGLPILSWVCAVDLQRYLKLAGEEASVEGLLQVMQQGHVWTAVHVRFSEAIGARNRRSWLEAALKAHLPSEASALADREVRAFLDFQTRNVNVGDQLDYVFPPGDLMWVRHNAGKPRKFTHPPLVRALRQIQFSDPQGDPGAAIRLLRPLLESARIRKGR